MLATGELPLYFDSVSWVTRRASNLENYSQFIPKGFVLGTQPHLV